MAVEISNIEEFQAIENDSSGDYVIINDIDANDTFNWNSGLGFSPMFNTSNPFNGTVDGQGYCIDGLYINNTESWYRAPFNYTGSISILKNINFTNLNITSGNYVGGVVAYLRGTIESCSVSGTLNGIGYVGGISGFNYGGTIKKCKASANLTTTGSNTGVMVGYERDATLENSYADGSINGDYAVGGLVGYLYGGTISNCYSCGSVAGNDLVGGLVGRLNSSTVTSSYWDKESSGVTISAVGTGKTTSEMQDQSTFIGWDFTNIWHMDDYPALQWEPVPSTPSFPCKVWDGSQWVEPSSVKVWDGSAWVEVSAIKYWNGTAWQ